MPGFFVRFEDFNMSKEHPIVIPDDPNVPVVIPGNPGAPIVIPDDPVPAPVASGIKWCEKRHDKSALTKVLPVLLILYHIGAECYAVQVAEVGINKLKVIIRADGYVDWLLNSEADAYRERYLKMVYYNVVNTLERDKAQRLADIWIQEHRDIESGAANEQDFAAGRRYVNTEVVYGRWN
jgi:hypothetical protein